MILRDADPSELDALARLWHDSWRDAHLAIVPAELTRLRTLENFQERMATMLPHVRVAGPLGRPSGFHFIDGDELSHFFVAAAHRGTGVAPALLDDAETQLRNAGAATAWLACDVGNARAARFYEKCGWERIRTEVYPCETPAGPFPLDVWRYEKPLTRRPSR